ncbi:MAG TPA: AgmX/PglI C-terminal domain-containing protein, partial [Labilithrix sp.]|nr:AgmX/PglI C-terminal domain-containing protein [Labilithrix sp.]
FNIDRNAKLDILAVSDGRVAVVQSGRAWAAERDKDLRIPAPSQKPKGGSGTRAKSEEGASETAAAPRPTPEAPAAAAPAPPTPTSTAAASGAADLAMAPSSPAEPEPGDTLSDGQGLGLSGVGRGGGGSADGLGLGNIGTIGHGAGTGQGQGYGSGAGGPPGRARSAPRPQDAAEDRESARRAPAPAPAPPPRSDERSDDRTTSAAVRPGSLTVESGIAADEVQRVVRSAVPRFRTCYVSELRQNPNTNGRVSIRFTIEPTGEVRSAAIEAPGGDAFQGCLSAVAKSLRFTAPGSGEARFTQTFDLVGGGAGGVASAPPSNVPKALPYEGRFKVVMEALQRGDKDGALTEANRWHTDQPGDVLSLVALGEVYEARHDEKAAARAYGSILELFSFRADSRRFAGERLERLNDARARALAVDTYAKAAEQRPDHPASHRLYAFALLKNGEYEKAFEAMKAGASRSYPAGRFRGVDRILKEDLGLVAAAWIHAKPSLSAEIRKKLKDAGGIEENGPSLRFVLNWETDANDVDFHIHDGKGGHAYYAHPDLPSGGQLYADVTTGYGPECFTIRGPRDRRAYPYTLQAHYYSRGPMGYGMGKLQVLEHDGNGTLSFEERPFVVMTDRAYVDMGTVEKDSKLVASK